MMPEPTFDSIRERFVAVYGMPPAVVARAPGRVNLIGEHTDYSDLPVLPIAIERALYVAAAPAPGGEIEAQSATFDPSARFDRSESHPSGAPWHRYLAGAIAQLADVDPGHGAKLLIEGDLPASGD